MTLNLLLLTKKRYTHSLIISPHQLKTNWPPISSKTIQPADLLAFIDFTPEIILIGTGEKSCYITPHRFSTLA